MKILIVNRHYIFQTSSSRRAAASGGPMLKEGRERTQVQLTEKQMRDMKTAFDLFDPHGTGTIDITGILVCSVYKNSNCQTAHRPLTNNSVAHHNGFCVFVLQVCLRVLGLPAQKDEIQKMLPISGKIDFSLFLRVMKQNMVGVN